MTELERVAGAILAQWRAEGGNDNEAIAVTALLDRVLPYRVARRVLGIDVSEDYEALMLRLLAQEEDLVRVTPIDAAELARATCDSRLPDLGVLQLLRSASVTLTESAVANVGEMTATPKLQEESEWAPEPEPEPVSAPAPAAKTKSKPKSQPTGEPVTGVVTDSTNGAQCWSCLHALPGDRAVKFCPFCGADQRAPTCSACGAAAERGWKHCAECGAKL